MRLRVKFAFAILAVTFLLSATVVIGNEAYKHQVVADVQADVDGSAARAADQLNESIERLGGPIVLAASRPRATRFAESEAYLQDFLAFSRFRTAQVVAANGTVLAHRGRMNRTVFFEAVGIDGSDPTAVRKATYVSGEMPSMSLRDGYYVSEPVLVPARNGTQSALVFSAPVFADGEVVGVFAATLRLTDNNLFGPLRALESPERTVVLRDGDRVVDPAHRGISDPIVGSARVDRTGMRVTVARDPAVLNARLDRLALFQGLGVCVVVVSMVGFGYWQYRTSLAQTERLLDGFSELESGNYEYVVSLSGGTEWERIADGVNELAEGVRDREARLRERKQRLQVLHRVLRHNLRNRLTIVVGALDSVSGAVDDPVLADMADRGIDAAEDLQSLSAKAHELENAIGEEDPKRRPIAVASLVETVVEDVTEEFPEVAVSTKRSTDRRAFGVPSVDDAIRNIVENACKHNDADDPTVEVTVTAGTVPDGDASALDAAVPVAIDGSDLGDADEEFVTVRVADDGPGIPKEETASLRAGEETDLQHASGLGLWTTYWVVSNSDGRLRFGENYPRGAVVAIDLPAAEPQARAEVPEPERTNVDEDDSVAVERTSVGANSGSD